MSRAWGFVPVEGRGSLPFALVHGESLVSTAAYALEAADVEILDPATDWDVVREESLPLVLHDPACPLTPVSFLLEVIERVEQTGAVVAGCRPVTDTVKEVGEDGALGATVDREALVEITSPVVLPPAVVALLEGLPESSLTDVVDACRQRWPLELVTAPPLGRRVHDTEELAVLEALSLTLAD
ncbi:MAG: 2-C-methyl-D-erythritol 4-phosphate cytidylyltransferase [Marmoricola sp.]